MTIKTITTASAISGITFFHGGVWAEKAHLEEEITQRTTIAQASTANIQNQAVNTTTPATQSQTEKILIVGDSLSAEYGLKRGEGWVALMDKRIKEKNMNADVQNASVSGETTSGGRSRIEALLAKNKPTLVVIELGANDALRGLPIKNTYENLTFMVEASKKVGASVLLVGMQIPPNFGGAYGRDFQAVFPTVAREQNVPLVDFLLHKVADIENPTSYFQSDRVHPNATAHPIILENVWGKIEGMINKPEEKKITSKNSKPRV